MKSWVLSLGEQSTDVIWKLTRADNQNAMGKYVVRVADRTIWNVELTLSAQLCRSAALCIFISVMIVQRFWQTQY